MVSSSCDTFSGNVFRPTLGPQHSPRVVRRSGGQGITCSISHETDLELLVPLVRLLENIHAKTHLKDTPRSTLASMRPMAALCTGEMVRSAPRISHTSLGSNQTLQDSPVL